MDVVQGPGMDVSRGRGICVSLGVGNGDPLYGGIIAKAEVEIKIEAASAPREIIDALNNLWGITISLEQCKSSCQDLKLFKP